MIDTALILAGGLGTRLRPLTNDTPKPLLPLKGKPIMQHVIENLKKHGVNNIILSIGYKADDIKNYFKDGQDFGVRITYSVENEPLGTGGAIKKALQGFTEPLFLIWGDNLGDIDYSTMLQNYVKKPLHLMMALTPVENVSDFGVAELDGDMISSFVEKPKVEDAPSNLINAGRFILDPKCLEMLPEGVSNIERDCFEKLASQKQISAFIHEGQWYPTDTLEKYRKACEEFEQPINLSRKKVIIADVDETICDSCQVISSEMAERVNHLTKNGYEFVFVSGASTKELLRMVSSGLTEEHHLLGTTGTNYTLVKNNANEVIYDHKLSEEERIEIMQALDKVITHFNIQSLTTKEDQLQDRGTQITLSAIGRNAPSEAKAKYDPTGEIRLQWVEFLKKHLDENKYEMRVAGTTSIDVTRKGLDKEWAIREFAKFRNVDFQNVLFFGDKIYPGGNDYPASKVVDCIAVKSPQDTLKKLKLLGIETGKNYIVDVRPWGKFEQFTHNEVSTVKILEVHPGKRLSLQSHENREEAWVALDDGVITEIDGVSKILSQGERVLIRKGSKHRLAADKEIVRVLEISYGHFDEDDIKRYEDDFGRC
jgi:HAD superfamily hydrolase (TIGR01484 family)